MEFCINTAVTPCAHVLTKRTFSCNEVATGCCPGATEESEDASVVAEEWGQRIFIAVKIAEISFFLEEQHLCKNEHRRLQFHACVMGKYTIEVQLLSDLARCCFCRVPCSRRDTAAIWLGATRWFPTAVETQAMVSLGWAPT